MTNKRNKKHTLLTAAIVAFIIMSLVGVAFWILSAIILMNLVFGGTSTAIVFTTIGWTNFAAVYIWLYPTISASIIMIIVYTRWIVEKEIINKEEEEEEEEEEWYNYE